MTRRARVTESELERAVKVADRADPPRAVMVDESGRIWLIPAKHTPGAPEKSQEPDLDDGDWIFKKGASNSKG